MKVLTFSRHFPKGHPKAGQPTYFVEKALLGLLESGQISISKCVELAREAGLDESHPMYYIDALRGYDCSYLKYHTIRAGARFKPGDMASLRVWSDKPCRSKQIEFAQVEVKKTWPVTIITDDIFNPIYSGNILIPTCQLAKNDGLECDDFVKWFMIHPKKAGSIFTGQIICWSNEINY